MAVAPTAVPELDAFASSHNAVLWLLQHRGRARLQNLPVKLQVLCSATLCYRRWTEFNPLGRLYLSWVNADWMSGTHKSCSLTPLCSWTGDRKFNKGLEQNLTKGSWPEIRTRRDLSLNTIMGKTGST